MNTDGYIKKTCIYDGIYLGIDVKKHFYIVLFNFYQKSLSYRERERVQNIQVYN